VKATFLDKYPGVLALATKGAQSEPSVFAPSLNAQYYILTDLSGDPYQIIRLLLEVSWALWTDTKVRRGLKVAAFGDKVIANVSGRSGVFQVLVLRYSSPRL
jgi:hypothetical protein